MKRNMPRPPEIMRKGSAHGNKRRRTGRETVDMDDIWDDLGEDYDPSPNCYCGDVWCGGKCCPIAENE